MEYNNFWFGSEGAPEGPKRLYYTCTFKNVDMWPRREIELSKAKHLHGKGKQNVAAVVFSNSKLYYVPTKIEDHFYNLVALQITDCDLVSISKDDLPPSIALKELLLSDNRIESLPADLFDNTPSLEILSFRNNKIKVISHQTLKPLKHLKFADFRGNTDIAMIYKSGEKLPVCSFKLLSWLRAEILLDHIPLDKQVASTVVNYVNNLWQGEFSDFKIQAGGEVFKVHKVILAVNSPVFAAMFSHEMEENLKSEMTMESFAPECIKEFLAFVYLRQVPKTCFNAVNLYEMLMEYQVKEFAAIIQWFIIQEVTVQNASEMFRIGVLYDNKYIIEAAFHAIEKFFGKELPEELMESVEGMTEILDAKDKLDEILQRHLQSIDESKSILQTKSCETESKNETVITSATV